MKTEVVPSPMSLEEDHLWRGLIRLMVDLPRSLDEELIRTGGLSLSRYVVLMRLSEAQSRAMRMSDLATAASLSPSRLTRIVQPMVTQGLVARQRVPNDARAVVVQLLEPGLQRLQEAWPAHLASVRKLVLDHILTEEMDGFTEVVLRLVNVLNQTREPGRSLDHDDNGEPV